MSPAEIALVGVVFSAMLSAIVSYFIAQRRLASERRLDIASYQAIRKLLMQTEWQMRSFGAIKHHLRGFEDDELRRLLVAAGAIAFTDEEGAELWGLLDRNEARIRPRVSNEIAAAPRPGEPKVTRSLFQRS